MSTSIVAGLRVMVGIVVYGAVFFGTAGTFDYWQAWAFLGVIGVLALGAVLYLNRTDPALLERRMRARETRPRQRRIMRVFTTTMVLLLALPGLDRRFGWSEVPGWLAVVALCVVVVSYAFVVTVLAKNSFASRTIGVEEGQELVTDGPYAIVRHPMYLGVLPVAFATPIALGSWWGVLAALPAPWLLGLRILDEEEALKEELAGYEAYMERTRRRLIPGVW